MAKPTQIEALIEHRWLKKGQLQDNFFKKLPLFDALKKDKEKGGRELRTRIIIDESSFKFIAPADTLDTVVGDFATHATWSWKTGVASIAITKDDMDNANTQRDMINLVDEHVKNAIATARKNVKTNLMLSTGVGAYANSPDGFARAFAAGTTAYGGLTTTEYAGWAPNKYDTQVAAAALSDAEIGTIKSYLIDAATDGSSFGRPTKIVTTRAIYSKLFAAALSKQQFVSNQPKSASGMELASLGHEVIEIAGIPVMVDSECPTNYMYSWNDDALWLAIHPDVDFAPMPGSNGGKLERVPRSLVYACDIVIKCQLVCAERRALSVLTNVDVTA